MIGDVLDKRDSLRRLRPFGRGEAARIEKLNLFDFLFSDLKLDGSNLTEEGVGRILEGGFVPGVSIREHNEIPRHQQLLKAFEDMAYLDLTLDSKQMADLYDIICGGKGGVYRRNTPVLFHLDYTPPYYTEVAAGIEGIFKRAYGRNYGGDFIRRAADLHNGIIRVYPYGERTEALARAALQYELVRCGIFPIRFGVSEQTYNRQITEAIKNGVEEPFYRTILDAAERKLSMVLSFFSQAVR